MVRAWQRAQPTARFHTNNGQPKTMYSLAPVKRAVLVPAPCPKNLRPPLVFYGTCQQYQPLKPATTLGARLRFLVATAAAASCSRCWPPLLVGPMRFTSASNLGYLRVSFRAYNTSDVKGPYIIRLCVACKVPDFAKTLSDALKN